MITMNRSLWAAEILYDKRGMDGRVEVKEEHDAILVSSRLVGQNEAKPGHPGIEPKSIRHAPCFDLDFNVVAHPDGVTTWLEFEGMQLVEPPDTDGPFAGLEKIKAKTDKNMPEITKPAMEELREMMWAMGLVSMRERPDWLRFRGSTPILEFVVPIRLIPSSNPHRFHLYIEAVVEWSDMEDMLHAMNGSFLNEGYAQNSILRRMTMLLKPGLWKTDLTNMGVVIERDSAGNLVDETAFTPMKGLKPTTESVH